MCLVVIGKYVPGFKFIATLISDTTTLERDVSYYQRLLASDQAEAVELIEQYIKENPAETVFDAMIIPALNYAERDRIEGRLSLEEEQAIFAATQEHLDETARLLRDSSSKENHKSQPEAAGPAVAVLGWAANGEGDAVALRMLAALLNTASLALEVLPTPKLSDAARTLTDSNCRVVCIADLPPSAPSRSRYLVRRLRAAAPDLSILVGPWAPAAFADESVEALREAGADHVGTTLLDTREQLYSLLNVAGPPSVGTEQPLVRASTSDEMFPARAARA